MGSFCILHSSFYISRVPRGVATLIAAMTVALAAGEPGGTAKTEGSPAVTKPTSERPSWKLSVGATGEDGTRSISATLNADAPIRSGFGEVTPKLVLRYRGGRTVAYVLFDTFLGEGELTAEVAFDGSAAEAQTWVISKDGRAAIISGEALAFAERLKTASTLSVRLPSMKSGPITATFSPRETELVLKALVSAGVKYGG